VQRTLGVKLDAPWLDHLRLGSVRLTTGCSAALVSPRGLLITNEHCVMPCLQALSDPSHDRLSDGFGLGEAEPPRACPGVQAEILVGIVDITSLVFDRSKGKTGAAFGETRERLLTQVERAAASSRSINTAATTTSGWSSPRSSQWPSSAATRRISATRAMLWMSPLCASTSAAVRRR
jgi:V8-like Glu-specific endopeptidase